MSRVSVSTLIAAALALLVTRSHAHWALPQDPATFGYRDQSAVLQIPFQQGAFADLFLGGTAKLDDPPPNGESIELVAGESVWMPGGCTNIHGPDKESPEPLASEPAPDADVRARAPGSDASAGLSDVRGHALRPDADAGAAATTEPPITRQVKQIVVDADLDRD